ncbi:hypothetical protein NOI24_03590 [Neorhizobium galegae]|jgi:hypothetical protein|uniref:hypothetical protein n=1 Tax=Neorhizobium galegae TaxID=399 RepID=UPI002107C511|nr:hypothetical protein [Neorhizobium galegae]MCQ1770368.1 hypothetical protein [Neorhizobium galegae]MCQ1799689.1 hypothetical protein [Neorhizobium galegae]
MQTARFEGWERDTEVAKDTESTWTNFFIAGDGPEDEYDICVIGEPDTEFPAHFDVTGIRNGESVIFAEGRASSFEDACHLAEIEARRASIRPVD